MTIRRPHRRTTLARLLTFGALLAAPTAALAQETPAPEPVRLAPEPVTLGSLGLSLLLPVDASVQTDEVPGGTVKMIVQPSDGSWVIQIYNSRSSNTELTAAQALNAVVEQVITRGPVSTDVRNGERHYRLEAVDRVDDLKIRTSESSASIEAARAYIVTHTQIENSGYPPAGYTVLRTAPGQFITIQMDCPQEEFRRARRVYETVIASATVRDPDTAARARAVNLDAGERFLQDISRDDLDALMGQDPVWLRMYEPASTGSPSDAKEIGYQRIEVRLGQLGELDPSKPKVQWTPDERVYGYLVALDARTLMEPTASAPSGQAVEYSDTRAHFFLSRDRAEEYWNINVDYLVEGERLRVFMNLVRSGPRVTVNTRRQSQPREQSSYNVLEKHYLSAVERVLLPRLVAQRAGGDTGSVFNMGFYTFDSGRNTIAYRSERFGSTPGGGWEQTTVPYENALPWTSTLSPDGKLITQALPPARAIEPITLDELHRLWTSKGLPTG